jgi:hypothetical protein
MMLHFGTPKKTSPIEGGDEVNWEAYPMIQLIGLDFIHIYPETLFLNR